MLKEGANCITLRLRPLSRFEDCPLAKLVSNTKLVLLTVKVIQTNATNTFEFKENFEATQIESDGLSPSKR